MPENKKKEVKTPDVERVDKSKETAATDITEAKVQAEKPKYFKTSDGQEFYLKNHAILHARTLEDKTITES